MQYDSPSSSGLKVMAKVKVKGLVTRNVHMQYESPTSSGLKVMTKVKGFEK